jgi:hypothetical protein
MELIQKGVALYVLTYTSLDDQSSEESTRIQGGIIHYVNPQQERAVSETAFRHTSEINTV